MDYTLDELGGRAHEPVTKEQAEIVLDVCSVDEWEERVTIAAKEYLTIQKEMNDMSVSFAKLRSSAPPTAVDSDGPVTISQYIEALKLRSAHKAEMESALREHAALKKNLEGTVRTLTDLVPQNVLFTIQREDGRLEVWWDMRREGSPGLYTVSPKLRIAWVDADGDMQAVV